MLVENIVVMMKMFMNDVISGVVIVSSGLIENLGFVVDVVEWCMVVV